MFWFFLLVLLNILLALLIFLCRNPIYSILSFVGVIFCYSLYLMYLDLDFLAFTLLVVYVGAIMVLFLFVMMMLNIKTFESSGLTSSYIFIVLFVVSIFFCLFFCWNWNSYTFFTLTISQPSFFDWKTLFDVPSTLFSIAQSLYAYYFFELFIIAFLLLIAMMGSIVLTLLPKTQIRKQRIFVQIERDVYSSLKIASLN